MSALTWRTEDPSTSRQAVNFLRDDALESRLTSLRDVATELLNHAGLKKSKWTGSLSS